MTKFWPIRHKQKDFPGTFCESISIKRTDMASATPPSCILLNVDMISEACDFEMIVNNKQEDEGKHSKNGGAERSKDRRTESVWDPDGITMHLN